MYVSLSTGSHLLAFSVHNKPKAKTTVMGTKEHGGISSQAQGTTALTANVFLTGIYRSLIVKF
jgi:hypothetical protein